MKKEWLFEALSEVGDDLVIMAEQKRFVSPWRKWGQTAAILAVVVCLGVLVLPYFPMGCGSAQETAPTLTMESAVEETEECVVEESVIYDEDLCRDKKEMPCECVDESKVPVQSISDGIAQEEDTGSSLSIDDVRRAVEEEQFDWLADTFVQPMEAVDGEKVSVKVHAAEVIEDDCLFLLISLPDQKGLTKEYIISFAGDSWRYETINEIMPDGISEMTVDN